MSRKLILSLYEPNPPEVIAQNQALLSQTQSTPAAWSLARGLLDRPDEKVRFIGVVTIIVKLNTERYAIRGSPSATSSTRDIHDR